MKQTHIALAFLLGKPKTEEQLRRFLRPFIDPTIAARYRIRDKKYNKTDKPETAEELIKRGMEEYLYHLLHDLTHGRHNGKKLVEKTAWGGFMITTEGMESLRDDCRRKSVGAVRGKSVFTILEKLWARGLIDITVRKRKRQGAWKVKPPVDPPSNGEPAPIDSNVKSL